MRQPGVRFDEKWSLDRSTGCWIWQGAQSSNGYGLFRADPKASMKRAHRWSYERYYGVIPDGMVLDHFKCETKLCVNPDHVRPVTPRENILRGNGRASHLLAQALRQDTASLA